MIELTAGQTSEKIVVTLNELKTLAAPNWLLRFVHVHTGTVVSIVRLESDDESDYPSRFNKFDINTAVSFLNKPPGEWHYKVYEQASTTNTDPDLATGIVEYGKMYLIPATAYSQTQYDNTPTTFKSYQG